MGNCYEDSRSAEETKNNQIVVDMGQPAFPIVIAQLKSLPVISTNIQNRMREIGPFEMNIPKTIYQLKNKSVYQGGFKNKLFDGPAKLILADGTVIESQFQDGAPTKKTRIFRTNGDYFSGVIQYESGKQSGKIFEKGILYEGDLLNRRPHGKGMEKTRNYNFQGQYENGVKISGKLEWNLQNPKFLQSYEGNFKNNVFHGFGTLKNSQGTYMGNFDQGVKSGYGQLAYPSGKVYKGNFVKNKADGQGKIYDAFGKVIGQGKWINGKQLLSQQNS